MRKRCGWDSRAPFGLHIHQNHFENTLQFPFLKNVLVFGGDFP